MYTRAGLGQTQSLLISLALSARLSLFLWSALFLFSMAGATDHNPVFELPVWSSWREQRSGEMIVRRMFLFLPPAVGS